MLDIFFQNPAIFILIILALIICISIHEFAHAFVSDKLGDPTARYLHRVTLDPRAHLDPVGTLSLILLGFGWGRPVPFNPINLKNPGRDSALIALAGPASNFIMAFLFSLLLRFLPLSSLFSSFLYLVILYNLMLGFFNLIPVEPLDGYKIVYGVLPHNLAGQWEEIKPFGLFIVLALLFTGSINKILNPLVGIAMKLLGLS